MTRKIFILGGAGYVGSELVNLLLEKNFNVTVYDLMIFGNSLKENNNLNIIKGDIRNIDLLEKSLDGHTDVIHLACISNDPSFELNPNLGKSINYDCFEPFVKICVDSDVQRFIFASSSSVYGIKKQLDVNEEMSLEPLTDYSMYKAKCEEVLLKYNSNRFACTILRPATVCGFSNRLRLDVVVNILTNFAYNKKIIEVFGGDQLRPNIHIKDMANSYLHILNEKLSKISGQIFNVGCENETVRKLAEKVKSIVGDDVNIVQKSSFDNRSYHISSEKIKKRLNFDFKYTIKTAIIDLVKAFDEKLIPNSLNDDKYYNIKRMQNFNLK